MSSGIPFAVALCLCAIFMVVASLRDKSRLGWAVASLGVLVIGSLMGGLAAREQPDSKPGISITIPEDGAVVQAGSRFR